MVVGIFVSINVLNSLKCTVTPLFFSINHTLYWFSAFCPKTKKKCEREILLSFLLKYDRNFLRMQVYVTFNYPSVKVILPEETILLVKMY